MPTKAQETYRDFLHADYGHPFSDFLGISLPKIEYSGNQYRYVRTDYNKVKIVGDWKPTKKAAKESYKFKLKALQTTRLTSRAVDKDGAGSAPKIEPSK